MALSPGDVVSLLTSPDITKGVVLSNDGYFITVQWITRPSMQGKVTTHREADLYKLAYRSSSLPTTATEGRGAEGTSAES